MESKGSSTPSQAQNASSQDQATTSQAKTTSYTQQKSRISKETLYMVLALWMEDYPVEKEDVGKMKRVGAVLVLPNDMVYAVDCTRDGVHGTARLLMKHPKALEDCKIFVSRKPCSICTKLLVQSKVKRVFYLPIEPEYTEIEDETSCVDTLFKVSAISQSVFVPKAGQDVFSDRQNQAASQEEEKKVEKKKNELLNTYWNEEWVSKARDDLPWPALNEDMKTQVTKDFKDIMEWIARIVVGSIGEKKFSRIKLVDSSESATPSFDPTSSQLERKQAEHLITLAKFLAERTDDPKTGVGAVIIKETEIVGLGWNGFPTKALFGEFPRASDKDEAEEKKKYPYIIHAEQNALLRRNTENIEGGTLIIVTKSPCNECTPLLEMQKIKTVVLDGKLKDETRKSLGYKKFYDKVYEGKFCCFELTDNVDNVTIEPASQ